MILDEVNNAVSLGLITVAEALDAIKDFPKEKILILTGRDAIPEIIERADLVTEMKDIKHPYEKGMKGKRGLEY